YLDRLASGEDAFDFGAAFEEQESALVDEEALDAEINRSNLINLFEASLVEAVRKGASDIHIVPRDRNTDFLFRIDGGLQLWHTQDKVHPEAMIAVAKDRCLNIDRFEREAAQDGYIQRNVDQSLIRYRVSVLPIASSDRGIKAESIVIRVLDDRNVFASLSSIGLLEGALERFEKAIRQPQGMVIMTGPTGSGKSTTLVAALHQVLRPDLNVLTVEDPVEYLIRGVRQIKLGPRLHLESALRSILRHDPDIVMVGEMRDKDTAELAIKLANTGHLTFSTLHTNDAPSAVSRLYKMGIEPFLLAYAINLVVAQRLLRKLCTVCRQVDKDPDPLLLRELGFSEEEIETTTFYKIANKHSCRECNGVGYKGRRAIAEALYFSRAIRHQIFSAGKNINEDAIRDTAVKEGMLTLLGSARQVVKMGETTIDEVVRVIASDD
ncbi:MAG: GspE/PulE family protein, partial [Rhodothermales bacterium]